MYLHVQVGDDNISAPDLLKGKDDNDTPNGKKNNGPATPYHTDDASVPIQVSVSDSGIGIPEDKIGTLFQSFSQVDTSITRNFGGTGLGLCISRQLCRLMHGDIVRREERKTHLYSHGHTFYPLSGLLQSTAKGQHLPSR